VDEKNLGTEANEVNEGFSTWLPSLPSVKIPCSCLDWNWVGAPLPRHTVVPQNALPD
jgi:hypothetical protein